MTQVFLTSASTSPWSKPGDWADAGHTVELVGAGGDGGVGSTGGGARPGASGGGGAYLQCTYSSGALGATTPFKISADNTSTSDADTAATDRKSTRLNYSHT